ncbi:MAG TPA: TonB-dependent receptor [Bacteroidia bacterium]|nr:TonB-dependent receptor [Bacteroidia bacterium]
MRAFLLFFLFSFTVHAQFKLQGKIESSDANFPVYNGIFIELIPSNNYTELKNGYFEFNNVNKGIYRIQINSVGFNIYNQTISITHDTLIDIILVPSIQFKDEVVVYATKNLANFTSIQSLNKEQIQKDNFGQDVPFFLQNFTSVNVSSDAGAGIGYTNMSVRGSDGTRINVTMNGIPLNDAESHGSFWVNLPDFLSSAENVTLQRGIGASTNGVAAFGANLNVQTNTLNADPYAECNNSYGSFNTIKNTIKVGTGLLNNKLAMDMRLSNITSDGYVDRASSNLKSYFMSAGYYGKKSILKFNHFTGKEKTYQAWNGVPQDTLATNRTYNEFNYKNQTDNYTQQHYQLFYSHTKKQWLFNTGFHYTRGFGYYEEYKNDQYLIDYNLSNIIINSDTITETDLIRRRWLDNHFYGGIYSITFNPDFNTNKSVKTKFVIGGAANQYKGDHFGEVIWSKFASNGNLGDKYYNDDAIKTDANQYLKLDFYFPKSWTVFTDLQYRYIDYHFTGFNDLFVATPQQAKYQFFNPKIGFMKQQHYVNDEHNVLKLSGFKLYGFYGFSNREPVRIDFVNSTLMSRPKHEKMHNFELGYEKLFFNRYNIKLNYYMQYYIDQLVLTGQINDVGAYTRTNVDKSYRSGIEIETEIKILNNLKFLSNATLSKNKILNFNEFIDDYDNGSQIQNSYKNIDIAYSPNVIAGAALDYVLFKKTQFTLNGKFVGNQFLDNTQNEARKINAYTYFNLRVSHTFKGIKFKAINLGFQVNNILNSLYEANGYTYSYKYAGEIITENFYYPQAGINYMISCNIKF